MKKKSTKRKPKLKFIDNPVQVQGFNTQRVVLPRVSVTIDRISVGAADPDRWIQGIMTAHDVKRYHLDWVKKQKRAVWLGAALGVSLFSGWLGLLYALAM